VHELEFLQDLMAYEYYSTVKVVLTSGVYVEQVSEPYCPPRSEPYCPPAKTQAWQSPLRLDGIVYPLAKVVATGSDFFTF